MQILQQKMECFGQMYLSRLEIWKEKVCMNECADFFEL